MLVFSLLCFSYHAFTCPFYSWLHELFFWQINFLGKVLFFFHLLFRFFFLPLERFFLQCDLPFIRMGFRVGMEYYPIIIHLFVLNTSICIHKSPYSHAFM